jgi:hypothetical protein
VVLLLFTIVDQNLLYKQISLSLCHDLSPCANFATPFLGPVPHRDKDYRIRSNFWKFYLIRTGFTLGEPVLLVKVFRLFRLERFFLCSYRIRSSFWKFYLIRTGFTLREPVLWVNVFRLFRLERIFFGCSECGHSR